MPRRVVSLVPSLTETVVALGRGDRLVGVTRYCAPVAPPGAAVVGGTKDVDTAAVARLAPDLVLANTEENRPGDLAALTAGGLRVLRTEPRRVREVPAMLRTVGAALGSDSAGDRLATALEAALEAALPAPLRRERPPATRTLLLVWRRPWMAAARDTYAADVLEAAGLRVDLDRGPDRYPRLQPGDPALADLDLVVLPSEPYAFGAADLPAVRALVGDRPRLACVDGRLLTWHGVRTAEAVSAMAALAVHSAPSSSRPCADREDHTGGTAAGEEAG